ncbi:hypothetical protein [Mycoplasma bradburyae]|uniref:Uncharacterized protein n=1 Tax=Mycoplasma bradburyae TaxID=2963128 RepID=A0ABT5GA77_9MOLU|nr:hypothetical protein [Mycoplasma bradburyae]MDC4181749.1 hypothetical protein [Mycoplasma bradburyae]UTS70206.1 hypothetical protein NMG68_00395 [Mycoplasma bradburyae]
MKLSFVLYLRNCANNLQQTLDLLKNEETIILLDESVDLTDQILENNNIDKTIIHKEKFRNINNALNYLFEKSLIKTDFYYIVDVRNMINVHLVKSIKDSLVDKCVYFWNLKRYQNTYKPVIFKKLFCENLDFINTVFYKKDIQKLATTSSNEITYFELLFQHLDEEFNYKYLEHFCSTNEPELFDMKLRKYNAGIEDQLIAFLNKMIEKNQQEYLLHFFENNIDFLKNITKRHLRFEINRKMSLWKIANWNLWNSYQLITKYKPLFKLVKK